MKMTLLVLIALMMVSCRSARVPHAENSGLKASADSSPVHSFREESSRYFFDFNGGAGPLLICMFMDQQRTQPTGFMFTDGRHTFYSRVTKVRTGLRSGLMGNYDSYEIVPTDKNWNSLPNAALVTLEHFRPSDGPDLLANPQLGIFEASMLEEPDVTCLDALPQ